MNRSSIQTARDERLLDFDEVLQRVGYSRRGLYKKIKNRTFPAPLKCSPGQTGRVRWKESDITAWIDSLPRAA